MAKATRHYAALDHGSFGGGNITGGLSTIEEKSIGAYAKSGTKPIVGMLQARACCRRGPASTSWTWCPTARPVGLRQHQRQRRRSSS